MRPYQKLALAFIILLAGIKYVPIVYNAIKRKSPVRAGQIWQIRTRVIPFKDNIAQQDVLVTSIFLIVSVDGNDVRAFAHGDTIDMKTSDFTFQGPGWQANCMQDVE
jgi:hypothetical protein